MMKFKCKNDLNELKTKDKLVKVARYQSSTLKTQIFSSLTWYILSTSLYMSTFLALEFLMLELFILYNIYIHA